MKMEQEQINKIMAGMDDVYLKETKLLESRSPKCHFKPMQFEMGEEESWWECAYCGHTKHVGFMDYPR
jgi:hypothetical protein